MLYAADMLLCGQLTDIYCTGDVAHRYVCNALCCPQSKDDHAYTLLCSDTSVAQDGPSTSQERAEFGLGVLGSLDYRESSLTQRLEYRSMTIGKEVAQCILCLFQLLDSLGNVSYHQKASGVSQWATFELERLQHQDFLLMDWGHAKGMTLPHLESLPPN